PSRYPDGEAEIRFERELRRRIETLPGVRAVAVAGSVPLIDDNSTSDFWVEGTPRPQPGEGVSAMQYNATPGFLQAMGARLLRGRDVRDDDDLRAPVVLIDDALARKLFGDKDPLGARLSFPPEIVGNLRGPEIVGVYGHMVQYGPGDSGPIQGGMSYGVVQRTREIGIRMALGARKEDVLRLVVGDGFRLAMGGIAIGMALAAGLSRLLRGMLYGVSPFDPPAYLGLTFVLALTA